MKHTFISRLSKEQFLEALKLYGRDEKELWEFRSLSERINNFYYKINGNNLMITKPTYLRHPLKAMFYGEVSSTKSGSKIEGEFSMPIFAKLFMILWFGMSTYILYFMTTGIGSAMMSGEHNREDYIALSVFTLFILLWIGLVIEMLRWSLELRENEEEVVLSFIKDLASLRKSKIKKDEVQHTDIMDLFVKYKPLRYLLMICPLIGGVFAWFSIGGGQLAAVLFTIGVLITIYNFYTAKKN